MLRSGRTRTALRALRAFVRLAACQYMQRLRIIAQGSENLQAVSPGLWVGFHRRDSDGTEHRVAWPDESQRLWSRSLPAALPHIRSHSLERTAYVCEKASFLMRIAVLHLCACRVVLNVVARTGRSFVSLIIHGTSDNRLLLDILSLIDAIYEDPVCLFSFCSIPCSE